MSDDSPVRSIRSYGRTRSRSLRAIQAARLAEALPRLSVATDAEQVLGLRGVRQVWLEVGFGGGEHLVEQAARRPADLFLGAEPFQNGVAACLGHIERRGVENVRLHMGDVRDLIGCLPSGCLAGIYILFPDPWQKLRHQKRRLVTPSFVETLADRLAAGGRLRFATDWADYAEGALEAFLGSSALRWAADRPVDFTAPPPDHVTTRYEAKRLGDMAPLFFDFIRRTPAKAPPTHPRS